ncbi:MAG: serine--tRNA ligase [Bacillota bacterium]|jgi:seryl-tRNA synthetase|nr:serine--tRNA ligase [Bacillota bacterium]HOB90985.1 serine--tRNA ligase [Bacillota bacterium]HPZ54111.1 serine--tRNA ligase [Bacillota bacterium]HQD18502.1 serine--tRNA ligase [Bacillota bacterium]
MLDINLIRQDPETVRQALLKRNVSVDFTELLQWDSERRELMKKGDDLRARRNKASDEIPAMKRRGEDVSAVLSEMKAVSDQIKDIESRLSDIEMKIKQFMDGLPNIPDDDVPAGGKECNTVVRVWGEQPKFDFEPKDHMELAVSLGLVDYERGAKLGGSGFWVYTGLGARLEWALLNYFVQDHIKNGYEFLLPPHILTYECGYTAGQFPKFEEDVFHLKADEGRGFQQFLLPTAETALVNLHRNEIIPESELPKRYFAYTPCYRREAGSYRTQERGMIRGHQFNKVELFQYTKPEDSSDALEELVARAEALVQGLGLHYRVSKLAAEDISASMAKTYDIEVWIPSINEYKEVSSASNARDYQARRGAIRFRREDTGKTEFVHTLNASGLATSRLFPAILEQNQQADGSVVVPEVLREIVGTDVIR